MCPLQLPSDDDWKKETALTRTDLNLGIAKSTQTPWPQELESVIVQLQKLDTDIHKICSKLDNLSSESGARVLANRIWERSKTANTGDKRTLITILCQILSHACTVFPQNQTLSLLYEQVSKIQYQSKQTKDVSKAVSTVLVRQSEMVQTVSPKEREITKETIQNISREEIANDDEASKIWSVDLYNIWNRADLQNIHRLLDKIAKELNQNFYERNFTFPSVYKALGNMHSKVVSMYQVLTEVIIKDWNTDPSASKLLEIRIIQLLHDLETKMNTYRFIIEWYSDFLYGDGAYLRENFKAHSLKDAQKVVKKSFENKTWVKNMKDLWNKEDLKRRLKGLPKPDGILKMLQKKVIDILRSFLQ